VEHSIKPPESGSEPVRAWLGSLPKDECKAIGEDIAYVQFEANRIARTLFAVEGRQMVLLHGFMKKTQQTPNDDIKLAEKRFKERQRAET
jgi:phage-related protein